jgi:hypothetical protein
MSKVLCLSYTDDIHPKQLLQDTALTLCSEVNIDDTVQSIITAHLKEGDVVPT